MYEFELHGRCHVDNPFRDAALVGEFTSPSGRKMALEGFYDGGDHLAAALHADEQGQWRYLLRGEGIELHQQGRIQCTAPHGHGFIRIHPENPYAFAYADGTPFFPMGDTCYGCTTKASSLPSCARSTSRPGDGSGSALSAFTFNTVPLMGRKTTTFALGRHNELA